MNIMIKNMPIWLELGEPYEYGFENNPFPLDAILQCIKFIGARQCGIVKTSFKYQKKDHVWGFIYNRFGGDNTKLSILGDLRHLIVGASFVPLNHPAERYLAACDFSIIPNPGSTATRERVSWDEWSNFIGAVRVQK